MKVSLKTAIQAIAFALAILLAPAATLADGFLDDDLSYAFQYRSDTEVRVTGLRNSSATHITIPSSVIYKYWARDEDGNSIIKHRTCRVTSIGWRAFDCSDLTNVAIGNNVTNIEGGAFFYCSGLTSVTIPNSVTDIGDEAFSGCSGLTSVAIPDSVTSIGAEAFIGCNGLTSVAIPDSVTNIGGGAFSYCSGLTSVAILGDIMNDWDWSYPYNHENYDPDVLGPPFQNCTNITTLVLGDKMTKIGNNMFRGCRSLTSVTIPDSVTNIGIGAFRNCTSLTSVTIPDSVTNIGGGAFSYCSGLTNVTIGTSVTSIGDSAFSSCSGLTSVVIPNSVTDIGYEAFSGCSGLTRVTIGNGVRSIGSATFSGCTNLTSVTIPDSVTSIGEWVFSGCSGLTSVAILGNVTNDWFYSDQSPFYNCTHIETLELGAKMTKIGSNMFYKCSSLTSVTIPDSVTSIGDCAFEDCRGLTSVTIGNGVRSIGSDAFSGCTNLTSVTIGNVVTSIGNLAFHTCNSLSDVCFKGGVPTVGRLPFLGVASGARGHYTADHAAEWEAVIVDGKWQGLIMEEVVPPVADPPVLRVDSANPAEGSLTLAWDEPATVEGVTYSVYRSANDTYSATDLVTNGLTGTTWTDTAYWSAEPVLKPLNYWVVADGGGYGERASNRVETRHRYGVFVGVGIYEESWFKQLTGQDWFDSSSDLPAMRHAELFGRLARENGGLPSDAVSVLTGEKATKEAFHNALQDVAQKVRTGDYVAIFCSTHGHRGWYKHFSGLAMHDALYSKEELTSDLEALAAGKNGLNVIVILNSCYSGGAYSASLAGQNFAWILTSKESEETTTFSAAMGTPLSHYLLEYGWNRGRAGQGPGTMATFADLVDYAWSYMLEFRELGLLDENQRFAEQKVLKHFIAGRLGSAKYESTPGKPTVTVTAGEINQTVSWSSDSQAEYFAWVRENEITGKRSVGMCTDTWVDMGEELGISYVPVQLCHYRVAAINEHGISEWSEPAIGTLASKFWKWLADKYVGFIIDESTSEETVAAVAASASANGASYEACYVADIDPNDPDAVFKAKLVRDDGMWKAYPMDGEKEGRVYRVEGKKEMSDESWTDVTDVEDLEAEGWHFFRVGVELEE